MDKGADSVTSDEDGQRHVHLHHPAKLGTPALHTFHKQYAAILDHFFFTVELAHRADVTIRTAAEALAKVDPRPEDLQRLNELEEKPNPVSARLKNYGPLLGQNLVIGHVDNFLSFLSETIQTLMLKRPELLRSNETVSLEEILRFSNFKSMIEYLADKKMNELSYGGIGRLEEYINKKTKIELFANEDARALAILAIEFRNVFTHNRGKISGVTMRRLKDLKYDHNLHEGQNAPTDFDMIVSLSNNLFEVASNLDAKVAQKFSIRRTRYETFTKC